MLLTDAHLHLQEPELAGHLPKIWPELRRLKVHRLVVNGTCEADWPQVAALAVKHAEVLPSFGLHPWYVRDRTESWEKSLEVMLDTFPGSGVGEIGLDRWIRGHDLVEQTSIFRRQLEIAATRNRPATIHCIQAWGALLETLRTTPLPRRGFLLHAFGGPWEMVDEFVRLGARFSFSPYFLHDRKAAQREVFRRLPIERLLLETDAPALWPPAQRNLHPLADPASGETINHPANLEVTLAGLAEIRGVTEVEMARQTEVNFDAWWNG